MIGLVNKKKWRENKIFLKKNGNKEWMDRIFINKKNKL